MKSLKIEFGDNGAQLVMDQLVEGTSNTAQKCLVNVGTILGSAGIYSSRGTKLLSQAVRGELINVSTAQHAANFAALNTLIFTRTNDPQDALDDTTRVTEIALSVSDFSLQALQLEAFFTFADGTTLGLQPTLTLT